MIGGDWVCTLWFLRLMLLGVCWMFLCPLQSLCPALSSGVNHNASARMAAHPISIPCRQPDLGCPVPPVIETTMVEGSHSGDSLYYPIQWVKSKDGATWELLRGLGYSGSSLPSCPSLSLDNLLYREDFPWSTHRVGVTWVQAGFTGQVLTSRRC